MKHLIKRLVLISGKGHNVPMIFTGGNGGDNESHAKTMYRVATAFGIQQHLMLVSGKGNNTFEEGGHLRNSYLIKT